ncbi:putative HTH-type transcriptional regulator [Meiothermus luteus]|jgi:DNA-binding HxlR family transcriptional regulator|uniref:Putative HTH-type transcriptional regulator n=1 Tax=Meiothermus luteus TaxID=2026184 RepID=A0A399EMB1_9DEIN|nr:helix-turn-helix domain-containing protein [Meiothermus luteus]RIH84189.1 putative HTH-type transcriptional regulator [Meiothermus luteus]RMH55150.1 MAG: transcriptional regulator [Deinococcota bacterium]
MPRHSVQATAEADHSFCPVYEAINILQEKWTLHIIRSLLQGPRGFNELSRAVGGCNPATLAQRLEKLEQLGIISKTIHSTMPPRTSYALTQAGQALQEVIEAIDRWSRAYLPKPSEGLP